MVIYVKSEGRLSVDMIERMGICTDENKWFVFKCNVSGGNRERLDFYKDNLAKGKYLAEFENV